VVKNLLALLLSVLMASAACSTSYDYTGERFVEDRFEFVVVDSSGENTLAGIEVFAVEGSSVTRIDITSSEGRWDIAKAWIENTDLLVFCWPEGPFDCATVKPSDLENGALVHTIRLPDPEVRHRWLVEINEE
jgi:hypothetical protein